MVSINSVCNALVDMHVKSMAWHLLSASPCSKEVEANSGKQRFRSKTVCGQICHFLVLQPTPQFAVVTHL